MIEVNGCYYRRNKISYISEIYTEAPVSKTHYCFNVIIDGTSRHFDSLNKKEIEEIRKTFVDAVKQD